MGRGSRGNSANEQHEWMTDFYRFLGGQQQAGAKTTAWKSCISQWTSHLCDTRTHPHSVYLYTGSVFCPYCKASSQCPSSMEASRAMSLNFSLETFSSGTSWANDANRWRHLSSSGCHSAGSIKEQNKIKTRLITENVLQLARNLLKAAHCVRLSVILWLHLSNGGRKSRPKVNLDPFQHPPTEAKIKDDALSSWAVVAFCSKGYPTFLWAPPDWAKPPSGCAVVTLPLIAWEHPEKKKKKRRKWRQQVKVKWSKLSK